jgi:hypothetical protein
MAAMVVVVVVLGNVEVFIEARRGVVVGIYGA